MDEATLIAAIQPHVDDLESELNRIAAYSVISDGEGRVGSAMQMVRSALLWAVDAPTLIAHEIRTLLSKNERHATNNHQVREYVWGLTGGRCVYCEASVAVGKSDDLPTMCIDHVVPQSVGGPDRVENYLPACPTCNVAKKDRHVLWFVRHQRVRTFIANAAGEEKT